MVTSMVWVLAMASMLGQESRPSSEQWNPVADSKAVVTVKNARFTVLTPAMIRMEWSPDGQFEDRASFAFVNRKLPVPPFKVSSDDEWTTIDTGQLVLRYKNTGEKFRKANLSIDMKVGDRKIVWKPRMKDTGNLFGTTRTLDGVSGSCPLEPGLLSRDGWTVVDDSKRLLFDNSDWPWVTKRLSRGALDWYFFGYGHDYKRALADFTRVAGKIPLPPRFVFGAWWSRYWAYSEQELRDLVKQFHDHDVPLDVLVIDMDWHLDGWTGYTWNPEYFPDPDGFLKWVHEQGLRATLNLHPADGVGKHEKAFPEMAKAMGLDPAKVDRVPFDCVDRKYMDAYFNILHHPMEKQGIDFWWIDWQQGGKSKLAGLDPLFWLNYLHWTDMERREAQTNRRPILFSRWGKLGNHRYQVGFSGDTFSVWPSLAFQPYFTSTAGNVGYAYWSHDIGGHQPGPVTPELYARWIQWGALSPVLRTHTTKNPKSERRIWEFPKEVFESARQAFQLRYDLIPYIYTAARQCYDTGLPLCRPLYYEWPELPEAYERGGEYLFGDQLLVAPVAEPADPISGCAQVKVWLPPGEWTNWFTGRTYIGQDDVRLLVPLNEIPLFVRSGGIIPTQPKMSRTGEKPVDPLILNIFPGDSGEIRIYEDDGIGPGYKTGQFAWTPVSHKLTNGERQIVIGPVEGAGSGLPKERQYEVRLWDMWPPKEVLVDGKALPRAESASATGWRFDNKTLQTMISLPKRAVAEKTTISIVPLEAAPDQLPLRAGFRGEMQLLRSVSDLLGPQTPAVITQAVAAFDSSVQADPTSLRKAAEQIEGHWLDYVAGVVKAELDPELSKLAVTRLLGLFCKVNTIAPLDTATNLETTVEVSATLAPQQLAPLHADVGLVASEPWRIDWESKHASKGPLSQVALPSPALRASLVTGDSPGTGSVRADITVRKGEIKAGAPVIEKELHPGKIAIQGEAFQLTRSIETSFLPSINAWWIVGPFDVPFEKAMDTAFPPEEKIDLSATYEGKDKKQIAWKQVKRPIGPNTNLADEFFVDFTQVFGGRQYQAVAYALAYLHAPEDMDATLALGSDDGGMMWLNGKEVFRVAGGRAFMSKQDRIPVHLKKGANTLLLKVCQGGGDWGFCVHVEDADGNPLTRVRCTLSPEAAPKK